jgi:CheY-like chemotaxis protein
VLGNLIGNAVKFTAEGEVSLRVDLIQDSGDRCLVRFAVRDTGIGIERDKAEHLFEYFVQGDNSHARRYGGTGLGLAIAGNLVTRMEGQISLHSEPGSGSTFTFTIPLAKQPPAEMDPETALAGARILIAHNSGAVRNRLLQVLASWGCRCEEAEAGVATLSCLREAQSRGDAFRLALIEWGKDGLSAAHAIKHDALGAPTGLLAISSVPLRAERARLRDMGFVGFLQEPVRESELLNSIVEALEATRNRPAADPSFERAPVVPFTPAKGRGRSARILLAEDNEINSRIALRILERAGYQADAVPNGKEAIAALDRSAYDMVLMDVQMPEMDGLEATAIIRHQELGGRRKTPIIARTANAMLGDRERCLAAGMDDYISKPVNIHELYRAIEKWAVASREPASNEVGPLALNRARL